MRHSNSMGTTWKFTNLLLEKQEIYPSCRLWSTVLAVGHTHCTYTKVSGMVPQQTFAQSLSGICFKTRDAGLASTNTAFYWLSSSWKCYVLHYKPAEAVLQITDVL
jgi:hypothetical protein